MHDIIDSVIENAKILKINKEENGNKDFEQIMSVIKKDKENETHMDVQAEDALKTIKDISSLITPVPLKQ